MNGGGRGGKEIQSSHADSGARNTETNETTLLKNFYKFMKECCQKIIIVEVLRKFTTLVFYVHILIQVSSFNGWDVIAISK